MLHREEAPPWTTRFAKLVNHDPYPHALSHNLRNPHHPLPSNTSKIMLNKILGNRSSQEGSWCSRRVYTTLSTQEHTTQTITIQSSISAKVLPGTFWAQRGLVSRASAATPYLILIP